MGWISHLEYLVAVKYPTAVLLLVLALVFGSVFLVSLAALRSLMVRTDIKRRAMNLIITSVRSLREREQERKKEV